MTAHNPRSTDKFEALTVPKPGAKMTTRSPRKAAKMFAKLIAENKKAAH